MSRKPFVVIDAEILSSSIWSETSATRLVWLTLLILCDTDGVVGASVPGIARAAGVTLEEALEALDTLTSPDEHSRTKTDEGRRLRVVDRGWRILNFQENLGRLASERARTRDRVKKWRLRQKEKLDVTRSTKRNVTSPVTSPQGVVSREKGKENKNPTNNGFPPASQPVACNVTSPAECLDLVLSSPGALDVAVVKGLPWSREACDDWIERFRGTAPGGQIGKALKPLVDKRGWLEVRPAWRSYLSQTEAEYASPSRFAATFGVWSGERGPTKSPTVVRHESEIMAMIRGGLEAGDEP